MLLDGVFLLSTYIFFTPVKAFMDYKFVGFVNKIVDRKVYTLIAGALSLRGKIRIKI